MPPELQLHPFYLDWKFWSFVIASLALLAKCRSFDSESNYRRAIL